MFFIDGISKIDLTVTVGVVGHHEVVGKIDNIGTVPSSITNWDRVWTITINESVVWAVFHSPFVFTDFNTIVDFTSIDGSVVIEITLFK